MRNMIAAVRALPLLIFLAAATEAVGHGGVDDGDAAPASAPGVDASLLTTYGATEQFELLLKYAPPAIGRDAHIRLYLADFATNRAIADAAFTLAFRPAGVGILQAPKPISPGIYEAVVRFARDTIYSLVATVTAEGRTDILEVRNIYAGDAARQFIAQHARSDAAPIASTGVPWWITVGTVTGILVLAGLTIAALRRMRFRRRATPPASAAVESTSASGSEKESTTLE